MTLFTTGADFMGVPASNTVDLLEGGYDFATQKSTDPMEIFWSDYALNKEAEGSSGGFEVDFGDSGEDFEIDFGESSGFEIEF